MNEIGKNIRFLRQQRNWSQDQLAESLHVTRQTVSNYETGRSRPDVEMLTTLAAALDADVKEILYTPADREVHIRRLRRLAVSAVVTALLGILEAAGRAWGQQLMQESYIVSVSYLVVFLVHPLFYLLLGWTLARGCLTLLRADPPTRRWAVWTRRAILAIIVVWIIAMAPWFCYLAQGLWEQLQYLWGNGSFSHTSSFRLNAFVLFAGRHPKVLSLGSALCGAALGILGFPGRRMVKVTAEVNTAQMEKTNSPE